MMTESLFARAFRRTGSPNMIRQFGEPVTYYAGGSGSGRTIKAMITREVDLISESEGVVGQATEMRVHNHVKIGISSTEIDTGGDEVSYPLRVGEDPQRKSIVRVISTTNGLVRFLVQ